MKFNKHYNLFKDHLIAKHFSERTVSSYTQEVKKFLTFIDENYTRINQLTQITKQIIADYQNYLTCYKDKKGKSLSSKTIKIKLISVKNFFKYLVKYDYIISDPTTVVELPREEKELPKSVLTEDEVRLILESIKTNTPIGLRNKAILELFYSTGMRTSELANLKITDVDLKEYTTIIYLGKGNKTRVVPIGQYAAFYISEYLEKSRVRMLKGKPTDDGYLFLTEMGTKFKRDTLNKCVIAQVMKNVKIGKKVSCYTFRHSIATHLVKNAVDIRYIAQLLGHESLKTTQKYIHLEISDLKKMHSLYHPREKR